MPVPLYQAKAEFFRTLGHPVRIRVLELLQSGPVPVRDVPAAIEVEPSALSRRLAGVDVADLTRAARRTPAEMLTGQNQLPGELWEAEVAAS
ncbi:ArsR/SmtB family transcription factor [Streptomyces sp. NBC_01089]|uniref:ArsR/SmtB family transcription factor n=1 Tax=Streptomyces sp. NBC_01089 TaxID=2903747 RepID=UPI003866B7E0|nr:transcriptional regulator [Streptomyces sp. NBC_01089]